MIEQIWMKGFESHRDGTEIELDPGVNIFIGDNNHGKSSIIRALDWIINGNPKGDAFQSADLTEVVITIDGMELGKFRDHKTFFSIGDDDMEAVGGTPQEITNLVNMQDINWQFQMDASFLLSETAGFVSKKLNETVNLQVMDSSLKYAKMIITEQAKAQEILDYKIKDCDDKLKWLEDNNFDAFDLYVEDLAELEEVIGLGCDDWEAVNTAIEEYLKYTREIKALPDYDETLIDEVEELANEIVLSVEETVNLESAIRTLNRLEDEIGLAEKALKVALEKEKKMMKGKCALCGK